MDTMDFCNFSKGDWHIRLKFLSIKFVTTWVQKGPSVSVLHIKSSFREFSRLWTRKEKEIAVVTHSGFLFHTLTAFVIVLHILYYSFKSPPQLIGLKADGGDPCTESLTGLICQGSACINAGLELKKGFVLYVCAWGNNAATAVLTEACLLRVGKNSFSLTCW